MGTCCYIDSLVCVLKKKKHTILQACGLYMVVYRHNLAHFQADLSQSPVNFT